MSLVPGFDRPVPPGGYAWWYVDALDHEGRHGLAIIGFVGSVFSPYYARARQRGGADPLDHCSINVGLYPPGGHCWSMTERRRHRVSRSPTELAIGPSALRWEGEHLRIDIDEVCAPWPMRLRGRVLVHPRLACERDFALEASGGHRWRPYVPLGEVEVEFTHPRLRWRGTAYCDHNHGDTPLEAAFSDWQWTRAHLPGNRAAVIYDARPRSGPPTSFSLRFGTQGVALSESLPPPTRLQRSAWGLGRSVCADTDPPARIVRGLESGPFYARTLVQAGLDGDPVLAMHETLSLDRFAAGWVRALLPFRMPRAVSRAHGGTAGQGV